MSVKEGTPGQRRSDVNMSPVACATERGGRRGYLAVMLAALLQVLQSVPGVRGATERRACACGLVLPEASAMS